MSSANYPLILQGLNQYTYRGACVEIVSQANLDAYRASQVAKFTRQIEIIEAAMAAGSIANPVWNDVKFAMSNLLEHAWEGLAADTWHWKDLPDDVKLIANRLNIYRPEMHTILGKIEKLRVIKNKHPIFARWLEIFEELAPLGEAFKVLSKNIVKRQPKPVEDRVAKYNAPSISGTATAKVRDLLIAITEAHKTELEQQISTNIHNTLNYYMDAQKASLAKGKPLGVYDHFCPRGAKFTNPAAAELIHRLVDGGINGVPATYAVGYEAKIAEIAEKEAASIRENFVYKNLVKIDSIVEAKGNYKSGEIIAHTVNLSGLRGSIRFTFTDGSNFVVNNSVVWVENSYGTTFRRFPLTFHDVILPNGNIMGRPSEKRMNEIFVKGGE